MSDIKVISSTPLEAFSILVHVEMSNTLVEQRFVEEEKNVIIRYACKIFY